VVVPVDVQIARGVMACNRPTDGTPFGGYSGWLYFRCPPYEDEGKDDPGLQEDNAGKLAKELVKWLADYGVEAACDPGGRTKEITGHDITTQHGSREPGIDPVDASGPHGRTPATRGRVVPVCLGCAKSWQTLGSFLRDPEVALERYRASPEDFHLGVLFFAHACGGMVEIPVSCLVRSPRSNRSLIGSHACPGLCYYETSLVSCAADCEGARYRRIARGLGLRKPRPAPLV